MKPVCFLRPWLVLNSLVWSVALLQENNPLGEEEPVPSNSEHLHFPSFLEKCGISRVELHRSSLRVLLLVLAIIVLLL